MVPLDLLVPLDRWSPWIWWSPRPGGRRDLMVPLDLVVNLDLAALTVLGPGPSEGLGRAQ